MLNFLSKKIFGSSNERVIKKILPLVEKVNELEKTYEKLTDEQILNKTSEFRQQVKNGKSLDEIIPDAFSNVREAAKRSLGQRHYDVQIIGGIVLHRGMIAEMKTGEGKTLVSTLAAYLNSLQNNSVHIVTVNDYLAKRDSEWMGVVYEKLGLKTGYIVNGMDESERKKAYSSDITYGTNNEFGFDYLRDNMKFSKDQLVQSDFSYAIIDEVDSILIDEARTPLIISGSAEQSSALYKIVDRIIARLDSQDYEKDEKSKSVVLKDNAIEKLEGFYKKEKLLTTGNLYDINNVTLLHHTNQSLKARYIFEKDKDYLVQDKKVLIVDEFTGRAMEGRRFSEGLHQAIEAKEDLEVQVENQTLASITYQNYFRLYKKLSGMTGTAKTEADEFFDIYKLEVVEVPTNKDMIRVDHEDEIYRTLNEKYDAIINLVEECINRNQPCLVGTVSIEKSESLSKILKKKGINHQVLNAKNHLKEAEIIAHAGKPGTVTIATNMAGRGTDIKLGEGVDELGGLFILGTGRHESRRIDLQLRGRAGRQGDPGESVFYLSLEDNLMRLFGSERIAKVMDRLGLKEGEVITHSMVSKSIERAQKKIESRNFSMRKNLIEYDDVMNSQRSVVYDRRNQALGGSDINEEIDNILINYVEIVMDENMPSSKKHEWNIENMKEDLINTLSIDISNFIKDVSDKEGFKKTILDESNKILDFKEELSENGIFEQFKKFVVFRTIDQNWKEHLHSMDQLKEGINLRAYGQKNPLVEYKREGYEMFNNMILETDKETLKRIFRSNIVRDEKQQYSSSTRNINLSHDKGPTDLASIPNPANAQPNHGSVKKRAPIIKTEKKYGRNDKVKISNGTQTKELKYKKAENLISQGWSIIE